MFQYSDGGWTRFERLMPAALFLLPTVMALSPLVTPVYPFAAVRFTPVLPILLQLWLISAGLRCQPPDRHSLIPRDNLVRAAAVILVVTALTTALTVAPIPSYALLKLFDLLLLAGVAVFSAALFGRGGRPLVQATLEAIVWSLVAAGVLVTILILFRIPPYFWWPNFVPGFVHVRIFGFAMTAGIALAAGLLALPTYQQGRDRRLLLLALTLLWAILFWTGTRGGVIALLIGFAVLAVAVPRFRRAARWALLTMVIGAALSVPLPVPGPDYGIFGAFTGPVQYRSMEKLSAGRLTSWGETLTFISRNPWFGHGYAQLITFAEEMKRPHTHAHNIVLEAALAWGWIGAACAAFLGLRLWVIGLLKTRAGLLDEHIPAFLLVTALLVYAFVDGTYYYYQTLIPFGLCVGILASGLRSARSEGETRPSSPAAGPAG